MKTTMQNSKNGLLSRSEHSGTGYRRQISFVRRMANRSLGTEKLLALLRNEAPRFFSLAEVVGRWVWIEFGEKQPWQVTCVLAEFGFHWNKSRQTWQHPCGLFCDRAASIDPRKKYRSYFPADVKPV